MRLAILCVLTGLIWPLAVVSAADGQRLQRYIIELHNPPIAAYRGEELKLADGSLSGERLRPAYESISPDGKLDVTTIRVRAYADYLQQVRESFLLETAVLLGRVVRPSHVYANATNGMALELTAAEAAMLAASPLIISIQVDPVLKLDTDAGPPWLGAGDIWSGTVGFPANRGEGVVIGIIDSGINWEHPSFADPSGGYHYVNPFGAQKGLCSQAEVMCNNKLIGVFDFVQDDPDTDEVEENNNGRDNDGHGSHVAGIAAGNRLNVTLNGSVQAFISGAAPHANLVSYRVCFAGDPDDPDGGGCQGSAILSAIDQAVTDGVDVINYSVGTSAFSPWQSGGIPMAFLNARNAGIFVTTSAGNAGPNAGTVGSPANAPWVVAVGNATHNRIFGGEVQNLSGGATAPPTGLVGASLTGGMGVRKIVHAKDFGNALCGTGTPELAASCAGNTGASNPWKGQTPFNGEIVVCDRGDYGRIEKGKNVLLAGAGGYILANTDETGEIVFADDHCLPTIHLGDTASDKLRSWLNSGSSQKGSLSGFFALVKNDANADMLSSTSSRGPVTGTVQEVLKPNMIAPGTSILSASDVGEEFRVLSGTSMASPHIAGSAALIRALHPGWSVSQIASALETTSTAILARDFDGPAATPHERGAGRPRLGMAANAGLFLEVTGAEFAAANPANGGKPGNLNLAGLVSTACKAKCSFIRKVTDQKGGGNWTASSTNFPAGTVVKVTPANFSLANGQSRTLTIEVDVSNANMIGQWVYGDVLLSSAGSPDQSFTTAVYSSGGTLPASWNITDDRDAGSQSFSLNNLVALPDITFKSGGLVPLTRTVRTLKQDPTSSGLDSDKGRRNIVLNDDPYDGGEGVFTVWHNLPAGGLWLHAETLASSAIDLDMYVGRDDNLNGIADEEEELCTSTTPEDIEECNLYNLPPGNYWIVIQNWSGVKPGGDEITLLSAAVAPDGHSQMMVTGPGIAPANQPFEVDVNWRNVAAVPGDLLLGAVGIGSSRDQPNNLGVIPIRFKRSAVVSPQAFPLFNGETQGLALAANSTHERIFIDVPPGTTSLNVQAAGANGTQSNNLKMDIFRQDFATAMNSQPFASLPGGLIAIASASGGSNQGPSITLGNNPAPGRYFVRLANVAGNAAAVSINAHVQSGKAGITPFKGLYRFERYNYQGGEYNSIGSFHYLLWYSFDQDGAPTFYNGSGPAPTGNIWVTDLLRYTNDGTEQQAQVVGKMSMTFIGNNEMIFSYSLLGIVGSDRMVPLSPNTCPNVGGGKKSYHGNWGKQQIGLGGATISMFDNSQSHIHYLFDARGNPKFLLAADATNNMSNKTSMSLQHFQAYCATCTEVPVEITEVGTFTRLFSSETVGSWTFDYTAFSPVQVVKRTDQVVKISDKVQCN